MARLPYVEPESEVTVSIKKRRGGTLRPLDKLLLHNPPAAQGWNSLLGAVRQQNSLTDADRELIICRVAALNGAAYEWAAHAPLAMQSGMSRDQVHFLGYGGPCPLTHAQRVLTAFTDAITKDCSVPETLFTEVENLLGTAGTQDAVLTASTYNMVSRYLLALDVGEAPVGDFTPELCQTQAADD